MDVVLYEEVLFVFQEDTEFLLEFFDCFVLEAEDLFEENCWECELALDYAVSLFCAVFVGAFLNDLDDFLPQAMML